ncbi:response regulator receiver sensor signal transduction histidine kinase [[Leptolyngbya] sp. PCC 7376]|uniref:hybrid sensor histidine kinase/response regulator n=1 Tax=[Leptolyngbya] sp. PCC 7376 TaxID=111781 RepID=UPI00029F45D4|nr:hybrid sensor histidine kinase/response regulator [[Leptolyngbya] sp. PCC 7376]AFY36772.1 response regulator receiver sensor signal transduction histidine kinase [[Leptolyngbya] sp. PCC 7376]
MSYPAFPRTPHILIVDDEPDNFDVIEGFLFTEDYQLSYVGSAQNALARLEKHLPDLILIDAMMPVMDGFGFCRHVRKNPQWQHIPVIMITALGSDYLADCLASGADDFLAKPINKVELRARVISMLRIKFQYDALKNSRQLRNDLTDMVVHDFTNPITTLLLQTEILNRMELPEKVAQGLTRIRRAARVLDGLRNDFLTYGRAEAGSLTLQKQCFVVREWVEDVVADFQDLARSRKVEIQIVFADGLLETFTGDRPLLARVLNNLLTNALKFSPFQTAIEIALTSTIEPVSGNALLRFAVKDWGQGIPNEKKDSIFQKYSIDQKPFNLPQTGLGLTFCKMVVEAHGGEISVVDNQPTGTIFQVEVPALAALPQNF